MNSTKCTYNQFEYTTITYNNNNNLHVLVLSGLLRKITDRENASDTYRPSLGNAAYAYIKNTAASYIHKT